jgi:general secretion pathway protein G
MMISMNKKLSRSLKMFLFQGKHLLRSSQGLSLIEILIALTILGLAGTFITGKVFESLHEGRVQSAKIQMQNIAARLKEFKRHCGFYPTTEQGLESLVQKPAGRECKRYAPGGYIEEGKVPVDPWDNEFSYIAQGDKINILSFGDDGQEGGEGNGKDLYLNEDGIKQRAP